MKKININLRTIANNKHAVYKYFIKKEIESGIVLSGWEVKAIRCGNISINNSYISLSDSNAYLIGAAIKPLYASCIHNIYDTKIQRKILLNRNEINDLYNYKNRDGYSIIVLCMYWKKSWIKLKIGIAKGKKKYDHRNEMKNKEWQLNKQKILKYNKKII